MEPKINDNIDQQPLEGALAPSNNSLDELSGILSNDNNEDNKNPFDVENQPNVDNETSNEEEPLTFDNLDYSLGNSNVKLGRDNATEYIPYTKSGKFYDNDFKEKLRAHNQSSGEQLGIGISRIVQNVVGELVSSVGYLAEIPMEAFDDTPIDYNNFIVETGQWIKNNNILANLISKDSKGKIYHKDPNKVLAFDDFGWWVDSGTQGVESVISFFILGYGVGAVTKSVLSKAALGGLKLLEKGSKAVSASGDLIAASEKITRGYKAATMITNGISALTGSATLAYTEGAMTGKDVYAHTMNYWNRDNNAEKLEELRKHYNETNDTTFDTEGIKKIFASKAAQRTVLINTGMNTATNLISMVPMFRSALGKSILPSQINKGIAKIEKDLGRSLTTAEKSVIQRRFLGQKIPKNLSNNVGDDVLNTALPLINPTKPNILIPLGLEIGTEGIEEVNTEYARVHGELYGEAGLDRDYTTKEEDNLVSILSKQSASYDDVFATDEGLNAFMWGSLLGGGHTGVIQYAPVKKAVDFDPKTNQINRREGRVGAREQLFSERTAEFEKQKADVIRNLKEIDKTKAHIDNILNKADQLTAEDLVQLDQLQKELFLNGSFIRSLRSGTEDLLIGDLRDIASLNPTDEINKHLDIAITEHSSRIEDLSNKLEVIKNEGDQLLNTYQEKVSNNEMTADEYNNNYGIPWNNFLNDNTQIDNLNSELRELADRYVNNTALIGKESSIIENINKQKEQEGSQTLQDKFGFDDNHVERMNRIVDLSISASEDYSNITSYATLRSRENTAWAEKVWSTKQTMKLLNEMTTNTNEKIKNLYQNRTGKNINQLYNDKITSLQSSLKDSQNNKSKIEKDLKSSTSEENTTKLKNELNNVESTITDLIIDLNNLGNQDPTTVINELALQELQQNELIKQVQERIQNSENGTLRADLDFKIDDVELNSLAKDMAIDNLKTKQEKYLANLLTKEGKQEFINNFNTETNELIEENRIRERENVREREVAISDEINSEVAREATETVVEQGVTESPTEEYNEAPTYSNLSAQDLVTLINNGENVTEDKREHDLSVLKAVLHKKIEELSEREKAFLNENNVLNNKYFNKDLRSTLAFEGKNALDNILKNHEYWKLDSDNVTEQYVSNMSTIQNSNNVEAQTIEFKNPKTNLAFGIVVSVDPLGKEAYVLRQGSNLIETVKTEYIVNAYSFDSKRKPRTASLNVPIDELSTEFVEFKTLKLKPTELQDLIHPGTRLLKKNISGDLEFNETVGIVTKVDDFNITVINLSNNVETSYLWGEFKELHVETLGVPTEVITNLSETNKNNYLNQITHNLYSNNSSEQANENTNEENRKKYIISELEKLNPILANKLKNTKDEKSYRNEYFKLIKSNNEVKNIGLNALKQYPENQNIKSDIELRKENNILTLTANVKGTDNIDNLSRNDLFNVSKFLLDNKVPITVSTQKEAKGEVDKYTKYKNRGEFLASTIYNANRLITYDAVNNQSKLFTPQQLGNIRFDMSDVNEFFDHKLPDPNKVGPATIQNNLDRFIPSIGTFTSVKSLSKSLNVSDVITKPIVTKNGNRKVWGTVIHNNNGNIIVANKIDNKIIFDKLTNEAIKDVDITIMKSIKNVSLNEHSQVMDQYENTVNYDFINNGKEYVTENGFEYNFYSTKFPKNVLEINALINNKLLNKGDRITLQEYPNANTRRSINTYNVLESIPSKGLVYVENNEAKFLSISKIKNTLPHSVQIEPRNNVINYQKLNSILTNEGRIENSNNISSSLSWATLNKTKDQEQRNNIKAAENRLTEYIDNTISLSGHSLKIIDPLSRNDIPNIYTKGYTGTNSLNKPLIGILVDENNNEIKVNDIPVITPIASSKVGDVTATHNIRKTIEQTKSDLIVPIALHNNTLGYHNRKRLYRINEKNQSYLAYRFKDKNGLTKWFNTESGYVVNQITEEDNSTYPSANKVLDLFKIGHEELTLATDFEVQEGTKIKGFFYLPLNIGPDIRFRFRKLGDLKTFPELENSLYNFLTTPNSKKITRDVDNNSLVDYFQEIIATNIQPKFNEDYAKFGLTVSGDGSMIVRLSNDDIAHITINDDGNVTFKNNKNESGNALLDKYNLKTPKDLLEKFASEVYIRPNNSTWNEADQNSRLKIPILNDEGSLTFKEENYLDFFLTQSLFSNATTELSTPELYYQYGPELLAESTPPNEEVVQQPVVKPKPVKTVSEKVSANVKDSVNQEFETHGDLEAALFANKKKKRKKSQSQKRKLQNQTELNFEQPISESKKDDVKLKQKSEVKKEKVEIEDYEPDNFADLESKIKQNKEKKKKETKSNTSDETLTIDGLEQLLIKKKKTKVKKTESVEDIDFVFSGLDRSEDIKTEKSTSNSIDPFNNNETTENDDLFGFSRFINDKSNQNTLKREYQWFKDNISENKSDFELVKGLIQNEGLSAVGALTSDGRVLISDEAPSGTVYHEAFERVWNLYLDDSTKFDLIEEFTQRKDFNEIYEKVSELYPESNRENRIKEAIAEDFRMFNLINHNPQGSKLTRWFNKLKKFLKGLIDHTSKILGNDGGSLKKLYNQMNTGVFKAYYGNNLNNALEVLESKGVLEIICN